MEPSVSVIVPIYNKEKQLKKCVESLISQSLKDIEIILVDDGSQDGSADICDDFSIKDSRVKVVHKPNGGVSSARNAGIDIAKGRYIGFTDGDDYAGEEMFETLLRFIVSEEADIAVCSYFIHDGEKEIVRSNTGNKEILDTNEGMRQLLTPEKLAASIWNKLYRRELFQGIRFNERQKASEDMLINMELFRVALKTVVIDVPLYHYVRWEGSLTKSEVTIKGVEQSLFTANEIFNKNINGPDEIKSALINAFARANIVNLYRLLYRYGRKNKDCQYLISDILNKIDYLLRSYPKLINRKYFAVMILANTNLWLYEIVCRFTRKLKLEK